MVALSIIIPVYNAAKSLKRCLDSILSQKYDNYEVILIDDKSVDDSLIICEEYVRKDSRIKLILQEHKGVGAARNAGLKAAKGKYTLFIDADDQLTPEALQNDIDLYTEDLVLALYNYDLLSNNHLYPHPQLNCNKTNRYDFLSNNLQGATFGVVWGKYFLTEKTLNIMFDESMRIGEDTLFTMRYLKLVQSYKVINRPIYIYTVPDNFINKYHHSVTEATNCLKKIYSAYKDLSIHCPKFETGLFLSYKELCQNDIYSNVDLWYKDKDIMEIYNDIKKDFDIRYRIAYKVMSHPIGSKFVKSIKHFLCPD